MCINNIILILSKGNSLYNLTLTKNFSSQKEHLNLVFLISKISLHFTHIKKLLSSSNKLKYNSDPHSKHLTCSSLSNSASLAHPCFSAKAAGYNISSSYSSSFILLILLLFLNFVKKISLHSSQNALIIFSL